MYCAATETYFKDKDKAWYPKIKKQLGMIVKLLKVLILMNKPKFFLVSRSNNSFLLGKDPRHFALF